MNKNIILALKEYTLMDFEQVKGLKGTSYNDSLILLIMLIPSIIYGDLDKLPLSGLVFKDHSMWGNIISIFTQAKLLNICKLFP